MEVFVVIIVWAFILAGIIYNIYNHTPHSKTNGKILKKDALICNIETENVGGRKISNAAIRTIVTFDDGFVYISHKSNLHFFQGKISVDAGLIVEIKKDAMDAHKKAYEKQSLGDAHNCTSSNEKDYEKVETEKNDLSDTEHTKQTSFLKNYPELFSPPYFKRLFEAISFLNDYEKSEHVEFTIFALYKSRLFLTIMLDSSKMSEWQKRKIVSEYDLFQTISFAQWLEDNVPDLSIDADVLAGRFNSYNNMLQNSPIDPTKTIESTLCWFLQNDIAFDDKEYDSLLMKSNEVNEITREKYSLVYKCLDSLVFEFCKNHMSELVLFYARGFNTNS